MVSQSKQLKEKQRRNMMMPLSSLGSCGLLALNFALSTALPKLQQSVLTQLCSSEQRHIQFSVLDYFALSSKRCLQ